MGKKPKKARGGFAGEMVSFEFDGRKVRLPSFQDMPYRQARDFARIGRAAQGELDDAAKRELSFDMAEILGQIADRFQPDLLDDLTTVDMLRMFSAWQRASGIEVGESPASA